ncbi:DUF3549 family protein [Microbulbifer halophilus]|uniref:DUF3549 family protein n=1 Tax=Microbulbifer halophilus TaxID=453963 RepID=A0ABW5E9C5_9GAMM|nr:DUF3549 family protein [Microbulbifer halophilus]MCW8124951.1 DUF3549 family protein [Microbulbifer halophilus]
MSENNTLSALIKEAQFKLRWFDLGRRLQPVSQATAEAFEAGQIPWPHPYLQHAWTGLLLWPEEGGEPVVWFLRLPLDERGKLQLPARDGLLRLLLQKLDKSGPSESASQLHAALEESGLQFSPAPERRASFHARAALLLKRPPSAHYEATLAYCREPQSHRWEQLGIQGIADLAARWEPEKNLLLRRLGELAPPVFAGLCQCLENEAIDHQLVEKIIRRARAALAEDPADYTLVAAAVRGMSNSPAAGLRRDFLLDLLSSTAAASANTEVITAIGSRCPQDLEHGEIAAPWLAALSEHQRQETFNLLLADLMYLPPARASLLAALRDPSRPEALARAFGIFLHGPDPAH